MFSKTRDVPTRACQSIARDSILSGPRRHCKNFVHFDGYEKWIGIEFGSKEGTTYNPFIAAVPLLCWTFCEQSTNYRAFL